MKYFVLLLVVIVSSCSVNGQKKESKAPATPAVKISDTVKVISRTDAEWKQILTPEQYHVLRDKGTDAPFTGKYTYTTDNGVYHCAACGLELFTSDMKFSSNCGWPSFDREVEGGKVKTQVDKSFGMERIEILCGRCGSHLGHLFDDGPTLTGKRYCVNSTSVEFTPAPKK
jgi:peptide-methionine (R)-S-oxide reductase